MSRFVWRTLFFLFLFVPSLSAAPMEQWLLPDYSRRVVFFAPSQIGGYVLMNLPSDGPTRTSTSLDEVMQAGSAIQRRGIADGKLPVPSSVAAYDAEGCPLLHRVVHADSEKMSVLVCIGTEMPRQPCTLYYDRRAETAASIRTGRTSNVQAEESVCDPLPVRLEIHKSDGKAVPNSWAKMFYLFSKSGEPVSISRRASFGETDLFDEKAKSRSGRWLVLLRSIVLCPQDGVYRFALDCTDAGFLLVDGEIVASWPGEHNPGEWHSGAPIFLKAGPHQVRIYNSSGNKLNVRLGWHVPDSEDIVSIPHNSLVTALEAVETRIERIDKSLHPNFSYNLLPTYSFRGTTAVFIPVRFENTTENWITDAMQYRWRFSEGNKADLSDVVPPVGGTDAEGKSPVHVFTSTGLHRTTLEVRDSLGFVGSCERTVDCKLVQPREYAISSEVTSLPAVCYAPDIVEPFLRIAGKFPDKESLKVTWEIRESSGRKMGFSKDIRLAIEPIHVALIKAEAGSIDSIRWCLMHHGVDLCSGTVKFLAPPFSLLPTRVEGDCLYDDKGTQLVFVPYRSVGRFSQPSISTERAFGKLVCIDDSLAVSSLRSKGNVITFDRALARIVNGPDKPQVKYVPLLAWDKFPGAYGPLLKLVQIPAAVDSDTDVVILSIGLRDILELKDHDVFERHVAALSDIISVSMRCPIVWVTPPPYPLDPGRVRPFAAAIRKVAEARGIPVADLFTAFLGMNTEVRSFINGRDLALSEGGQNLTAQVIARSLLSEGKGN